MAVLLETTSLAVISKETPNREKMRSRGGFNTLPGDQEDNPCVFNLPACFSGFVRSKMDQEGQSRTAHR